MVLMLCLLSRDSHGDTGKLNHEETVRGPEIAIFPEKSEILLLGKPFLPLQSLLIGPSWILGPLHPPMMQTIRPAAL